MTTPSPGRGWRWLRVGEIFKRGDEYKYYNYWIKKMVIIGKVHTKHTYRRRVKKGKR